MLAWVSCQSTQSDAPQPSSIATPVPTRKMAKVSGKSYSELMEGYRVYQENCAKCHEHRLPSTATFSDYHAKIHTMAGRAQLTEAQETSLQTYLGEFSDR